MSLEVGDVVKYVGIESDRKEHLNEAIITEYDYNRVLCFKVGSLINSGMEFWCCPTNLVLKAGKFDTDDVVICPRDPRTPPRLYDSDLFVSKMVALLNTELKIEEINERGEIYAGGWFWRPEWLKTVNPSEENLDQFPNYQLPCTCSSLWQGCPRVRGAKRCRT